LLLNCTINHIVRTRVFFCSALVCTLAAAVCSRIPLFNSLGFEFSAAIAIAGGFTAGICMLGIWKNGKCESVRGVRMCLGSAAAALLLLSLLPLLIALGNIVFVKNCSVLVGLEYYFLCAVPSFFFCGALAFLVAVVCRRFQKTAFIVLFCLILAHIPYVTLLRPQIFAFNPVVGCFPGITYDESMNVLRRLLIYRLGTTAATVVIAACAVWLWARKQRSPERDTPERTVPEFILLALFVPFITVLFFFSDRIGLSSSEDFIREKLGGTYRTAHCEIVYPPGTWKREYVEQIGMLQEYYYEQLAGFFQVHPAERMTMFFYADPDQKEKLIGASGTDISKPWLRQSHINAADAEHVLKHEMAHLFAAEFGWSPLRIAKNSGLIEGAAVAADGVWYEDSLHRTAALVFASGVPIDAASVFDSFGFAVSSAGTSYALAGSFCSFLIDSYGVEKFKELYAAGSFRSVYGRECSALAADWEKFIRRQTVSPADSVKARFFFKRESIFQKECARVIANFNQETEHFLANHEYERALVSAEYSLRLSRTTEAVRQKISALFGLQKFREVLAYIRSLPMDGVPLTARLRLGDAYWALDSLDQARHQYETLLALHLTMAFDEACSVRLASMDSPERASLKIFFIYPSAMEDTAWTARCSRLSSSPARYLSAGAAMAKEQYGEAEKILESPARPSPILEFYRLRLLGKALFFRVEDARARNIFQQALAAAPSRAFARETKEWIGRCVFSEKER
jgi:tetratricopeptide (TPR) repeat protein